MTTQTPTPDSASVAARNEAIAATGWGARMTWRQPRNACVWLYFALIAVGIYYLFEQVGPGAQRYPTPVALSIALFVLYSVPFWWFTTRIDRYSKLPVNLKIAGFLYGGIVSTFAMAVHANNALLTIWQNVYGTDWTNEWGAGVTAPFDEELAKGTGILLLMFIASRVVRTAFDGFILGAFVGLGFQVVEDVLYGLESAPKGFGTDPVSASLSTVVVRMATGLISHISYSALFGAGLVFVIGTVATRRQLGKGLLLCLLAMLFHGAWDASSGLAFGHASLSLVVLFADALLALVALWVTFHLTVGPERDAMRTVLTPEVETGVVTQEELDALAGNRRARSRYRRHGRLGTKRFRKHRLEAGHDLADELGASGGADSEGVLFTRSELDRLRREAPAKASL